MSDGGFAQFQRGLILMEQSRYADAATFFRESLAEDPRNGHAFNRLAICQLQIPGEAKQALETITRALECEPNESSHHAVKSFALGALNRDKEALVAAREAVSLEPDSMYALNAEAHALLSLERWTEAEQCARRALAIDADDSTAANQLAHALRLQNKMDENAGQIAGMLARDPEDAGTHCSAGWSALQRGDRRAAEQHFLESLRLDPEMEPARDGLLDAFRARSPIYRAYLAYCFRMQQLSSGARWGVVLGLYFGVKFSRILFTGPMKPVGIGIAVLYAIFVFWVWIAKGIGNFILLFDRFAKHALRRNEKIEALFVGGGVVLALLLVGSSFAFKAGPPMVLGLGCGLAAIPFSLTFTNDSKIGAWLFGAFGALALLGGILLSLSMVSRMVPGEFANNVFTCGLFAALGTTWLGNIGALRR
jgi:tetratricopeptide (TPR) repeat protein